MLKNDRAREAGDRSGNGEWSAFRIPHSAFRIPHSALRIPHSALLPEPLAVREISRVRCGECRGRNC